MVGAGLTVCLTLVLSADAGRGQTLPTVTITASTTAAVLEGESASFVISRTGDTANALTVNLTYAATEGTHLGSLWIVRPATVDIAANDSSATIQVDVRDNPFVGSPDSGIVATISTSSDYTVGTPGSATVNTADDGDQWLDMFTTGDPLEVFEGVGSQVVTPVFSFRTVEASTFRAEPPDPISYSIVSREGPGSMQATVTDDYLALSMRPTVEPGEWTTEQTSQGDFWEWSPDPSMIQTSVVDDDEAEPPEEFEFVLQGAPGANFALTFRSAITDFPADTVRIYDNEIQFVIDVAGADALSGTEGEQLVLDLTAESKWLHACNRPETPNLIDDMELSIEVAARPDSAIQVQDFNWVTAVSNVDNADTLTRMITFDDFTSIEGDPTGACRVKGTATATIDIVDDAVEEPAESFDVIFTALDTDFDEHIEMAFDTVPEESGETPTASLAVAIPTSDTPVFSVDSVSVVEGSVDLEFTVTLRNDPFGSVTVDYATADVTATAGDDYTATNGTLTFNSGDALSQTVTVGVLADFLHEPDETLTLTLSAPSRGTIATGAGTGTIIDDDDPLIDLGMGFVSVAENDGTIEITVTLHPAPHRQVTVDYTTVDSTATAGSDYETTGGMLTFAVGETAKTISVPIVDDGVGEPEETFELTFSNLTNAVFDTSVTISELTVHVDIVDNDDRPTLFIRSVSALEGAGEIVFTVTLEPASDQEVTVEYTTGSGTATAGTDYTAITTAQTLTFAANETSMDIVVTVLDDAIIEPNETVEVVLANPTGNPVLGLSSALGTILDDDTPGLSVADASGSESAGQLVFTVTLDRASAEEVTVEYTTSDDTVGPNPATAGTDYTAITTAQTLTFAANVTSMDIVVTVADDSAIEPDETFILTLANPTGATIATGTATGTIRNDDVPGLSVADASGSESAGQLVFTVTLDHASAEEVTVEYTTSDDTVGPNPATAGTDYTAITTAQTLTFAANVTSMDIVVTVTDDSAIEPDETFILTLANPNGATIATGTATGTIRNDDVPGLSVADASGLESAGRLVFTVTLEPASDQQVTVEYTTSDDTVGPNPATAGTDYTAITTARTLTFAANVTSMDIVVTVANDSAIEPDETFILTLANPNGATIATGTATGTIRNDDAPGLSVADASGSESAGRLVFTVTLDHASAEEVTVEYTTSDDTVGPNPATAGTDYTAITTAQTLTFAANVTSMDIVVTVANDSAIEPDETFILTLANPNGATIATGTATGTIRNDDAPGLSVADASGSESAGRLVFTVTLEPASDQQVTVEYTTSDDTVGPNPATAGTDYTAITTAQTLTFAANVTSMDIVVTVADDSAIEPDETFILTLANPNGATIATGTATGTIRNDDRRAPRPSSGGGGGSPPKRTDPSDTATTTPRAPRIGAVFQDRVLALDSPPIMVDLVAGLVGDVKNYRAISSVGDIVTATVSGSQLTLTPLTVGVSTISVSGSNASGSAFQSFQVTVVSSVSPTIVSSVSPTIVRFIGSRVLAPGAPPTAIDLSEVFSGTVTSYQAVSSNPAVLHVRVTGSRLSLTGLASGTATVSVSAKNPSGAALLSFEVRIVEAGAPRVARFLRGGRLPVGERHRLDLSAAFTGSALRYQATAGDPGVVHVEVSDQRLYLTGRAPGVTTVSVSVTNSQGAALQSFRVTVDAAAAPGAAPAGPAQEIPTS